MLRFLTRRMLLGLLVLWIVSVAVFVTLWGGYVSLYVAAAVVGLLGAVFVVKIKGVA